MVTPQFWHQDIHCRSERWDVPGVGALWLWSYGETSRWELDDRHGRRMEISAQAAAAILAALEIVLNTALAAMAATAKEETHGQ